MSIELSLVYCHSPLRCNMYVRIMMQATLGCLANEILLFIWNYLGGQCCPVSLPVLILILCIAAAAVNMNINTRAICFHCWALMPTEKVSIGSIYFPDVQTLLCLLTVPKWLMFFFSISSINNMQPVHPAHLVYLPRSTRYDKLICSIHDKYSDDESSLWWVVDHIP